jgi:threonine/homoserine/homoserine lactone efflux protein
MEQLWQLLGLAGVLLLGFISPGPNFIAVTSITMGGTRRAGLLAGLAMGLASATWTLMAVVGMGAVLKASPAVLLVLRYAGAAYLIWLGVKLVLGARGPMPAPVQDAAHGLHAFRRAYLVSMTNPKALAFYASVLTVIMPPHPPLWFSVALVAIAGLVSAGWYCAVALGFSHPRVLAGFARAKFWIEGAMGLALMAIGARLMMGV